MRSARLLTRSAMAVAAITLFAACDLALYDPEIADGAAFAADLENTISAKVDDWPITDNNAPVQPTAYIPDRLDRMPGWVVAESGSRLYVVRVDDPVLGTAGAYVPRNTATGDIASIPINTAAVGAGWDAWVVPTDPSGDELAPLLVAVWTASNPVALWGAAYTGRDEALGVVGEVSLTQLPLESYLETQTGAASLRIQSVGGVTVPAGQTFDGSTVGVVTSALTILATDTVNGNTRDIMLRQNAAGYTSWISSGAAPAFQLTPGGTVFTIPAGESGDSLDLVRYAIDLSDGRAVLGAFDGDYTSAPPASFAWVSRGAAPTDPSAGPLASTWPHRASVGGWNTLLRSARTGTVATLELSGALEVATNGQEELGSLWYAGQYASAPGDPLVTPADPVPLAELYTQVGLLSSVTGTPVLSLAAFRR